jgi:caffeoyl-CoA O-methyltransferase
MTSASAERDTSVDQRVLRPGRVFVDPDVTAYSIRHTSPPTRELAKLRADTQQQMKVPTLSAGIIEARLLEALTVATRATRVLDVGTFSGASALSIASRLPPAGKVITIEREPGPAALARRHFERSAFADRIESIVGDARVALDSVDGPFDLVFLDAWKRDYWQYFEAVLPKLASHGVVVADNVLWRGLALDPPDDDPEAIGIRTFAERVRADPRVDSAMLTIGDGLLLIWRAAPPAADR